MLSKPKIRALIKPLGDFELMRFSDQLEAAVRLYGCEPELSLERIRLHDEDYVASRQQYDATRILSRLLEFKKNKKKVIGVTSADIFVPGLNFVFGLADMVRGVALLSTARLTAFELELGLRPSLINERVFKEVAHELGHLFGLTHCSELSCIMSFANSIYDVDRKLPMLCSDCLNKLSLH
ncbi:MAG: archaemetzincin family Zn-dependent metalloprotease [archaeon]|nr:archaemetzincin family Zn-dependent metalloprotease [archaeon]